MKSRKNLSDNNAAFDLPKQPITLPKDDRIFECAACKDIGVQEVFRNGAFVGVMPCRCAMLKTKRKNFGELFVPKTLANYEAKNNSMKIAKDAIGKDPFGSFFIFGNVGLGKTHLIAAIYELYYPQRWQDAICYKESGLLEEVKTKAIFDKLKSASGIFLDDIGKVRLADWDIQAFFDFYDEVYRRQISMIISSNYSLETIAEVYGGAIARRIEAACEILEIKEG